MSELECWNRIGEWQQLVSIHRGGDEDEDALAVVSVKFGGTLGWGIEIRMWENKSGSLLFEHWAPSRAEALEKTAEWCDAEGERRLARLAAVRRDIEALFGESLAHVAAEPPPSRCVTASDVARMYDRASGIEGWKANLVNGGRVELTPPAGYAVTSEARLVRLDLSNYGFKVGSVLGDSE